MMSGSRSATCLHWDRPRPLPLQSRRPPPLLNSSFLFHFTSRRTFQKKKKFPIALLFLNLHLLNETSMQYLRPPSWMISRQSSALPACLVSFDLLCSRWGFHSFLATPLTPPPHAVTRLPFLRRCATKPLTAAPTCSPDTLKCRTLYQRWLRTWGDQIKERGRFWEDSRRETDGGEENKPPSDRDPFAGDGESHPVTQEDAGSNETDE